MERLTKWNESSYKHAYYPRCFKEPCYGSGCKIKDCPFEIAVCERLAAYEDIGLTPEEIKAPFTEDAMINLAAQARGWKWHTANTSRRSMRHGTTDKT